MIINCKMCGGSLSIVGNFTVCECDYCGSKQTVPQLDNEKKINLYSRANRLRLNNEFDKAAGLYESICVDFPDEAEAYWGLVLCKYGIEYVDDPVSGERVPTCHRSSYTSVFDDSDYNMVLQKADQNACDVYVYEATRIEAIRKGIIEVSNREQPYDIFICYKETDYDGNRTIDSVMAQEVYEDLIEKGYRVFFSRITLEDKLGVEYEPYIFAALNSAKVMLVFGTEYDFFNAIWVKNEWSRFLKLMATDRSKFLIPCYKNIDVYDMPKEFSKLQSQDMSKVGARQDLLHGIEKIVKKKEKNITGALKTGDDLDISLERAQALLNLGNYQDAAKAYARISQDYPSDYRGWWGLVICEIYDPKKKFRDNDKIREWHGYTIKLADSNAKSVINDVIIQYLLSDQVNIAKRHIDNIGKNNNYLDISKQMSNINQKKDDLDKEINQIINQRSIVIDKQNYSEVAIKKRKELISKTKIEIGLMIFACIFFSLVALLGCVVLFISDNKNSEAIGGMIVIFFILFVSICYKSKANKEKRKYEEDIVFLTEEYDKAENQFVEMNKQIDLKKNEVSWLEELDAQYESTLNEINDFKGYSLERLGKYYVSIEAADYGIHIDDLCDADVKSIGDKIENILKKGHGLQKVK